MTYRLNGKNYATREDRLQEFVRIGELFTAKTGCPVQGFDPGFSVVSPDRREAVSVPTWLVLAVIGEGPKRDAPARPRLNDMPEGSARVEAWKNALMCGSAVNKEAPEGETGASSGEDDVSWIGYNRRDRPSASC